MCQIHGPPTTPQRFPCFFFVRKDHPKVLSDSIGSVYLNVDHVQCLTYINIYQGMLYDCMFEQSEDCDCRATGKNIQKNIFSKSYLIIIHFPHSPPTDSFHENTNQLNLLCSTGHFDFIISFPRRRAGPVAGWIPGVIPGCGDDLFNKTFEEQTKWPGYGQVLEPKTTWKQQTRERGSSK